jgi:hypothetical protein
MCSRSVQAFNGQRSLPIPEKALTHPNAADDETMQYHPDLSNSPRPSTPFQFALAIGGSRTPSPVNSGRSFRRSSIFSFITNSRPSSGVAVSDHRLSGMSAASSTDQGASCKVRQLFDPILPDELVLRLGERVTVVRSFDDGWCAVGRPGLGKSDEIEIGVVPAWSFVKPLKGHRLERPMRFDSLGTTARLSQPVTRQSLISWSKF